MSGAGSSREKDEDKNEGTDEECVCQDAKRWPAGVERYSGGVCGKWDGDVWRSGVGRA